MSAIMSAYLRGVQSRRRFVIGVFVLLSLAVTTGFIWMQNDHVIAPPGLRMLTWLWNAFVPF